MAQVENFPSLINIDSGVVVERHEYYDGSSLWGLINGGADIYLEYGMTRMLLEEVSSKAGQLRAEIYQMDSPSSAFGIYSISKGKDTASIPGANYWSYKGKYQVQFCKGCYYGSLMFQTPSEDIRTLAVRLANQLANKIPEPAWEFPGAYSSESLSPFIHKTRYFRGVLGIQNGAPDWLPVFENIEGFELIVTPVQRDGYHIDVAFIRFTDISSGENELKKSNFLPGLENYPDSTGAIYFYKPMDKEWYLAVSGNGNYHEISNMINSLTIWFK